MAVYIYIYSVFNTAELHASVQGTPCFLKKWRFDMWNFEGREECFNILALMIMLLRLGPNRMVFVGWKESARSFCKRLQQSDPDWGRSSPMTVEPECRASWEFQNSLDISAEIWFCCYLQPFSWTFFVKEMRISFQRGSRVIFTGRKLN